MAYIGSTPTSQSFIAGTDTFSGTGSQTAFTLSRAVNSVNDILVVVNNVDQQPSTYSVSGLTLTFSAAPSSGTNNVYVRYLTTTLQSINPSQGSVSPDSLSTGAPYWNASGNVGIGNSSPDFALDVTGSIAINTATANHLTFHNGSGVTYAGIRANSNSNLIFAVGNDLVGGEQARIDSAGLFKFNSGYGSVATAYGCRAWVNFNGTGTVAIRASGGVSSISDNGVGNYTINFTTTMPDANYSLVMAAGDTTTAAIVVPFFGNSSTLLSSSARFRVRYQTGSTTLDSDADIVCAAVFR